MAGGYGGGALPGQIGDLREYCSCPNTYRYGGTEILRPPNLRGGSGASIAAPAFRILHAGAGLPGKAVFMIDVCNMTVIRSLAERSGFHFSKAKGQNFLTQRWVPARIAEEAGIDGSCGVLEVGPGFGPLTQQLCLRAGKVVAVEVDTSLKPVLAETMADFSNFTLLFADVMKTDLNALVETHFLGLKPVACANLPYYITSPILSRLLESRLFSTVTVMVQKEVAQRICAGAGSSDYSAFTVFCQYYAEPSMCFDVPPSCFVPQPKVTSAVLKLTTRSAPPCEILSEKRFFRVVKASFAQRRKTLLNSLSSGFGEFSKQELQAILERCGISPTVRGETLDIAAFAAIANTMEGETPHD